MKLADSKVNLKMIHTAIETVWCNTLLNILPNIPTLRVLGSVIFLVVLHNIKKIEKGLNARVTYIHEII